MLQVLTFYFFRLAYTIEAVLLFFFESGTTYRFGHRADAAVAPCTFAWPSDDSKAPL